MKLTQEEEERITELIRQKIENATPEELQEALEFLEEQENKKNLNPSLNNDFKKVCSECGEEMVSLDNIRGGFPVCPKLSCSGKPISKS